MFRGLFGKQVQKVNSLEDLQDERAVRIVRNRELDIIEILPRYLDLAKELEDNRGKLKIDMGDSNTPLNVHNRYIKNLACGAVISYEFTKRAALKFPVSEEAVVIGVDEEFILAALKINGDVYRTAPVQLYEQLGAYYEEVISLLEQHQERSVRKIIDTD